MASTNLEMSIKTLREYINRMMDKCERAVELSVNSMINKDMDLAKRLKVYRNFKHLTQKEVASHLNVPHSAISDIENGKRDVTVSELKILSHLYGRSVEEIMSGKKYDYYNIANIARLLTELPDDDLKEVMFIIEYKRKRVEEKNKNNQ